MNKIYTCLITLLAISLTACKKNNFTETSPTTNAPENKMAPDGFNFKTSKTVTIDITLRTNDDKPLSGILVSIYNVANTEKGNAIYSSLTDQSGNIKATITVAAGVDQLIIDPAYVGLMRYALANINGNGVKAIIGGKNSIEGDIVAPGFSNIRTNAVNFATNPTTINFGFPAPFKTMADAIVDTQYYPFNLGKPKYLLTQTNVIPAAVLRTINTSLPESQPLPQTHPQYLNNNLVNTLNIVKSTDVTITFVSEGAANLNTLAFYTYKTGNAPGTEADIKNATYIFPNASYYGGGGGLNSGQQVNLGHFEAGTSIGFILISNAWTGSGINVDNLKYYSDSDLNPADEKYKKHSVLLFDDINKLFIVGIEDVSTTTGDNDYDDLVFYATPSAENAISATNVAQADNKNDTDGDGVIDGIDMFPDNPRLAYVTYFPSEEGNAQIMFEDNWPAKGDYDMNDLVVNYKYTFWLNAKNQIVDMAGFFMPTAAGASYKSGFGVELPVAASAVKSVFGQHHMSNYIKLAANGVESGQNKAVIVPFDNFQALLRYDDGSYFVNTRMEKNKAYPDVNVIYIEFASPVNQADLAPVKFNPFLISKLDRGREIHLPGFAPTALANRALFGTTDDDSHPESGRYYQAKDNGPWALAYDTAILYPQEEININKAYLHFSEWAASGGTRFTDWHSNTAQGYRNKSLLYTK